MRLTRGLRRVVDALQRSLFDDVDVPRAPLLVPLPGETAWRPAVPAPVPEPTHEPVPQRSGQRTLIVDGRALTFSLKRARRRTIGFVVSADGLAVSAPRWVALRDIDAAVHDKGAWIAAKLAEQRERHAREQAARTVWQDGAMLTYLGAPLQLVLDRRQGLAAGEVRLEEGGLAAGDEAGATANAGAAASTGVAVAPRRLLIGLPAGADEARVREAVQSWLKREALRVFSARCAHFAPQLGVVVTRLSLSSAETRWGSANANGAIRLHWRLIHHALPTIDYVVAHELAHLREMNHGPRFWAAVRSVVPEYERERKRLRDEPAPQAGKRAGQP